MKIQIRTSKVYVGKNINVLVIKGCHILQNNEYGTHVSFQIFSIIAKVKGKVVPMLN